MAINDDLIIQLIKIAESPNTSQKMFAAIIEEHSTCFGGQLCDVCDYFENDYMARNGDQHAWQELMPMLARNTALPANQQKEVFELSSTDHKNRVFHLHSFLENDNLADYVKEKFLVGDVSIPAEDHEWWFEIAKMMVEHNPRFSREERKKFVEVLGVSNG